MVSARNSAEYVYLNLEVLLWAAQIPRNNKPKAADVWTGVDTVNYDDDEASGFIIPTSSSRD